MENRLALVNRQKKKNHAVRRGGEEANGNCKRDDYQVCPRRIVV
jgi:hypothetical protein